eukprot:SAG22_NODE_2053_length_3072_cov_3.721157_3_plen_127_part_00
MRALYSKYDGPLYNVTKPDGTSKSIGLLAAGGFADKKAHDQFCDKLDCVISNVFDQSPHKNHLGQRHKLINASRHSVTVGPDKTPVYGMWCVAVAELLLRGHVAAHWPPPPPSPLPRLTLPPRSRG